MKQSLLALLFSLAFIGLHGCADEHIISTNEGHMISSEDEPELNDDTKMLEYEDEEGRDNQVPIDDVKEVKER